LLKIIYRCLYLLQRLAYFSGSFSNAIMRFFLPVFIFTLSYCFPVIAVAQSDTFCKQLELIQKATKDTHFAPKNYDNDMSKGMYALFMKYLDEEQINFTQEQVNAFAHLEKNIDNALRNNDCNVLRTVTKEYKAYMVARVAFLKDNLNANQDYSGTDKLVSKTYSDAKRAVEAGVAGTIEDDQDAYFHSNEARLYSWSKFLRLEILTRIARTQPTLVQAQASFITEEERIRKLLINEELCSMDEFFKDGVVEKAIEEIFLHAYLTYQDPHSAFFNPTEKESYESSLATDQETYGFYVAKNNNDEYYIAHLIPGSSANVNARLQENDVVLELKTTNSSKNLTCTSAEAINGFLASPEHKNIELLVRKKNGNTVKVALAKHKTAVEENVVRGYLVGAKRNTGYLRIPSFYTDLDATYGLGIANDVAKEIYRLKQEQITGLLIDLRGNGGGSLKEAIDLLGLFIDRGPLSQIYLRNEELDIAQDFNHGAAYKGPLVVLVDSQSASASELFAATIQIYGRGVIAGQPTYGKATVQNVFPLSVKDETLGYLKMTKGAFFNVDGSTHQGNGVQPHIVIPMIGAARSNHEKDEPFFIPLDTISNRLAFKAKKVDLNEVVTSSRERIAKNALFQTIQQQDTALEFLLNSYPNILRLDLQNVYNMIQTRNKGLEAVTEVAATALLLVDNIRLNKTLITRDAVLAKSNKELLESISKDPHIAECYFILKDLNESRSWD